MRLFKQLLAVFIVVLVLSGALLLFTYDIIKVQWVSFMGVQPSYGNMEEPLPVPARSIPVEGPANIPGFGAPDNPVPADAVSVARGAQLFAINCVMCHGTIGLGNGQLVALLANKPANLTLPITQTKSDSALFLIISNGVAGRMPAMNENLTVRERWDVINFLRTLTAQAQ
jgi:mono/diheme cytochrome c family protein